MPQCDSTIPVWLRALQEAVDASSQKVVAERLGISRPAISQVLSGTYGASTSRIEERVRGLLMQEVVDCPVLGELGKNHCHEEQGLSGPKCGNPSPLRLSLRRACRSCVHNLSKEPRNG